MKKYIAMIGISVMLTSIASQAFAYTCPKGFSPVINQAGKQSGCRKN